METFTVIFSFIFGLFFLCLNIALIVKFWKMAGNVKQINDKLEHLQVSLITNAEERKKAVYPFLQALVNEKRGFIRANTDEELIDKTIEANQEEILSIIRMYNCGDVYSLDELKQDLLSRVKWLR